MKYLADLKWSNGFKCVRNSKITMKPFELATVPASPPDEFKALNELPGTSKVGESEGLFVRGGDASETKAIIDGLIVQDPYFLLTIIFLPLTTMFLFSKSSESVRITVFLTNLFLCNLFYYLLLLYQKCCIYALNVKLFWNIN